MLNPILFGVGALAAFTVAIVFHWSVERRRIFRDLRTRGWTPTAARPRWAFFWSRECIWTTYATGPDGREWVGHCVSTLSGVFWRDFEATTPAADDDGPT